MVSPGRSLHEDDVSCRDQADAAGGDVHGDEVVGAADAVDGVGHALLTACHKGVQTGVQPGVGVLLAIIPDLGAGLVPAVGRQQSSQDSLSSRAPPSV